MEVACEGLEAEDCDCGKYDMGDVVQRGSFRVDSGGLTNAGGLGISGLVKLGLLGGT